MPACELHATMQAYATLNEVGLELHLAYSWMVRMMASASPSCTPCSVSCSTSSGPAPTSWQATLSRRLSPGSSVSARSRSCQDQLKVGC